MTKRDSRNHDEGVPRRRSSRMPADERPYCVELQNSEEFANLTKKQSQADFDVITAFRDGARRPCNQHVWKRFAKKLDTESPKQMERFGITRGETSRVKNGIMSTDVQYALLSECELTLGELDTDEHPLPSLRVRGLVGYGFAIYCMKNDCMVHRSKLTSIPDEELITEKELSIVLALLASEKRQDLQDLRRKQGSHRCKREKDLLTPADWELLWKDIFLSVTNGLDIDDSATLECRNGAQLKKLDDKWGDSVKRCRDSIPFRWIEEDENARR